VRRRHNLDRVIHLIDHNLGFWVGNVALGFYLAHGAVGVIFGLRSIYVILPLRQVNSGGARDFEFSSAGQDGDPDCPFNFCHGLD